VRAALQQCRRPVLLVPVAAEAVPPVGSGASMANA
jgi:hypothetical protein